MPKIEPHEKCPACGADLPQPTPRLCPVCARSLQQRYLKSGCLSSAPPLVLGAALFLRWFLEVLVT